ncbi:MAG: CBS domain-containing protein [Saprospiraceae bacterium]|nr:CBS domain-containing protein [Saprospiraceae bacterium]
MNASSLISDDIIPLRTSTLGSEALEIMSEFHLAHLPIVNDKQLLGILSEEDILEHDVAEPVGAYHLSLSRVEAKQNDHIFDVMGMMTRHKLTSLPVVDEDATYLGLISDRDLLRYFGNAFAFDDLGGIIVLQMSKPDYSLSEIARIVESEQTFIISTFITSEALSNRIQVHLRLNTTDLQRVVAALERFEYDVQALYTLDDSADIYKDRYESFMHYLGM